MHGREASAGRPCPTVVERGARVASAPLPDR
ncbi:hypothetical protein Ae406Ps2_4691c [Pseudonocardia sp. Ae406_Ps2]|nr:hypothetical protein Ae406Ps2_4691c [Pseudonocardia sp. Ae406_Ps2]OLM26258.1 hypothetical protein Ae706Ps2_4691c [Pseudonocardia sp. Ae706_Ps2]